MCYIAGYQILVVQLPVQSNIYSINTFFWKLRTPTPSAHGYSENPEVAFFKVMQQLCSTGDLKIKMC